MHAMENISMDCRRVCPNINLPSHAIVSLLCFGKHPPLRHCQLANKIPRLKLLAETLAHSRPSPNVNRHHHCCGHSPSHFSANKPDD